MRADLFALGAALLFCAHVARAARHSLLFNPRDDVRPFYLLVGLGFGFAFNVVAPWRLGEIVRMFYVTARTHLRLSRVAATIFVERVSDLFAVSLLLPATAWATGGAVDAATLTLSAAMFAAALAALGAGALTGASQGARRLVWRLASIFNDRIMQSIVNFVWTSHELMRTRYASPRYLAYTVAMWAMYFLAYAVFAAGVDTPLRTVVFALLGAPLESQLDALAREPQAIFLFSCLPVVAILGYGLARERAALAPLRRAAQRVAHPGDSAHDLPAAFRDVREYGDFLKAHFAALAPVVASFGVQGVGDAVIHRTLPGGSDALTAVVEVGSGLRIRKFAIGEAARRLARQADWLRAHRGALSLCDVSGDEHARAAYRYDMPFVPSAHDFYEFIHTHPVERSAALLTQIVEKMDGFHRANESGAASEETIQSYLRGKAAANADRIVDFARAQLGERFEINGEVHRLSEWDRLRDAKWLRAQIRRRETSLIHGDLTIENIIVSPADALGWYIIDPNPDNVFDSPLLDWAKMMQSLHLGYESLNRAGPATVTQDGVRLIAARSNAYALLHAHFRDLMRARYGEDGLREIAFHELVHYLRLTPYKIRNAPSKALTFFAATATLLRAYGDA